MKFVWRRFPVLVALFAFPALASAQVMSDPQSSTQIPTRSPSDIAREEANQGNPEGQLRIGFFYEVGFDDVPQDCAEAIQWYLKAADQGNTEAQESLGRVYDGAGILRDCQDRSEAVKWYRKLADQGNEAASARLAVIFESGDGVPQDHVEAMKWFQIALDRNDYSPYFSLRDMYYRGRGVKQDDVTALMWAYLAAASPELRSNINIGQPQPTAAQVFVEIAIRMTPAEIAEAQRRAREWSFNMAK
jgi:hypothetical protein